MFDPERDEDRGSSRYYRRLLLVVLIGACGSLLLWPAIHAFSVRPAYGEREHCVAIADAWHPSVEGPATSDELVRLGACGPQARHRVLVAGAELAALAGVVVLAGRTRRRTRNGRSQGAAVSVA